MRHIFLTHKNDYYTQKMYDLLERRKEVVLKLLDLAETEEEKQKYLDEFEKTIKMVNETHLQSIKDRNSIRLENAAMLAGIICAGICFFITHFSFCRALSLPFK